MYFQYLVSIATNNCWYICMWLPMVIDDNNKRQY